MRNKSIFCEKTLKKEKYLVFVGIISLFALKIILANCAYDMAMVHVRIHNSITENIISTDFLDEKTASVLEIEKNTAKTFFGFFTQNMFEASILGVMAYFYSKKLFLGGC